MKKTEHVTLNISNSSSGNSPFNVFGASYNGFNIQTPNVSIGVPQSSAGQLQADNLNTAFTITEMKISVNNVDQLDVPFNIKTKEMTGQLTTIPFTPSDYTDPANAQPKLIDAKNLNIKVNGDVGFEGTLLPNTHMSIFVSFEYDYRPSNFIEGISNYFSSKVHRLLNLTGK